VQNNIKNKKKGLQLPKNKPSSQSQDIDAPPMERSLAMIEAVLALRVIKNKAKQGKRRSELASDLGRVISYLKYYS